MDPNLGESYIESQVGLLCVKKFPVDRPAKASVVFMLANDRAKLPWYKQPAFFTETSSIEKYPHNQEHSFDLYSRVNLDLCTYKDTNILT